MTRTTRILALSLALAGTAACGDDVVGSDLEVVLGCDRILSHTLGSTSTGTLTSTDCRTSDNAALDVYRFTVSSSRDVTIVMRSNDLDSYLFLLDEDGNVIDEDDDSDPSSTFGSSITRRLSAGTYYIGANTFATEFGSYTLRTN